VEKTYFLSLFVTFIMPLRRKKENFARYTYAYLFREWMYACVQSIIFLQISDENCLNEIFCGNSFWRESRFTSRTYVHTPIIELYLHNAFLVLVNHCVFYYLSIYENIFFAWVIILNYLLQFFILNYLLSIISHVAIITLF